MKNPLCVIWNLMKSSVHIKGTTKKKKKALFLQQKEKIKKVREQVDGNNFNFVHSATELKNQLFRSVWLPVF